METGENVEQVKNVENSEPVVSETSASVSGNNGKSLSKSARNRRNKRLRNQEKPNDSQNGTPNQGDGSEKKLTLEEKMQRRKHFVIYMICGEKQLGKHSIGSFEICFRWN